MFIFGKILLIMISLMVYIDTINIGYEKKSQLKTILYFYCYIQFTLDSCITNKKGRIKICSSHWISHRNLENKPIYLLIFTDRY